MTIGLSNLQITYRFGSPGFRWQTGTIKAVNVADAGQKSEKKKPGHMAGLLNLRSRIQSVSDGYQSTLTLHTEHLPIANLNDESGNCESHIRVEPTAIPQTPSPSGRVGVRGSIQSNCMILYPLILVAPGILPPATLVHPCTSSFSRREKGRIVCMSKTFSMSGVYQWLG